MKPYLYIYISHIQIERETTKKLYVLFMHGA